MAAALVGQTTAAQSAGDPTGGEPCGRQWWITRATGSAARYALGSGGQHIHVVPALDLVVSVAAGDVDAPLVS